MKKKKSENQEIIDLIMNKQKDKLVTGKDVSNFFGDLYGDLIQALLEGEMEAFLGYEKGTHEEKEDENRRNGYSSKGKKVKTKSGEFTVDMPRDRKGKFDPIIVGKRQRVIEDLDEQVITMYSRGMTLEDIKETIKSVYKIELSNQTISTLTASVSETVEAWQNRELKECYPFIYVDCIYCYVKENLTSVKKAVYVMLGIDTEGKKEVLGIWINKSESATFWNEIFEEVKTRGVKEIFFVSMDGLKGLEEAIEKIYPKTITQRCIVHIVRNLYSVLNKKEAGEIIKDFKKIYTSATKEMAEIEYKEFKEKYKENKLIMKFATKYIEEIIPLFDLPINIRKYIYTNNIVESVNLKVQRGFYGRGALPNADSALNIIYVNLLDLEKKWNKSKVSNWNNIFNEIQIVHKDVLEKYI